MVLQIDLRGWGIDHAIECRRAAAKLNLQLVRETLIKLSFSKANAATVSADEAEDTGDDEWL